MDDRRFDALTRALGRDVSRRTLIKGLLGIGGLAAVSSAVFDDTDAARRGFSAPNLPQQTPQSTEAPIGTATATDTATNTVAAPSNTPVDTPTRIPATRTNTPVDTPTSIPATRTNTPNDTPTATTAPPTNTPITTATPVCTVDADCGTVCSCNGDGTAAICPACLAGNCGVAPRPCSTGQTCAGGACEACQPVDCSDATCGQLLFDRCTGGPVACPPCKGGGG